jgi:TolA-binding protein
MKRAMYIAAVVLFAVMVCVLAVAMKAISSRNAQAAVAERERLEQTILDLQGQVRQVKAQDKSSRQKVSQLQDAVVLLTEQRNQDRQVIKDLWALLATGTRREKEATIEDNKLTPTAKDKEGPTHPDEPRERGGK